VEGDHAGPSRPISDRRDGEGVHVLAHGWRIRATTARLRGGSSGSPCSADEESRAIDLPVTGTCVRRHVHGGRRRAVADVPDHLGTVVELKDDYSRWERRHTTPSISPTFATSAS
jgi:hypothetical protein